ncbi:MAG: WG repeat-containing protein, partial [bacterium]|nr:WG repeat-containing protein [bacterium]
MKYLKIVGVSFWLLLLMLPIFAQQGNGDTGALFVFFPENRFGFIDAVGGVKIKPQYQQANDFKEGLAAVQMKGKWGFIDGKGN